MPSIHLITIRAICTERKTRQNAKHSQRNFETMCEELTSPSSFDCQAMNVRAAEKKTTTTTQTHQRSDFWLNILGFRSEFSYNGYGFVLWASMLLFPLRTQWTERTTNENHTHITPANSLAYVLAQHVVAIEWTPIIITIRLNESWVIKQSNFTIIFIIFFLSLSFYLPTSPQLLCVFARRIPVSLLICCWTEYVQKQNTAHTK